MKRRFYDPEKDPNWDEHYGRAVREAIASGEIKSEEEFDWTVKNHLCLKRDMFDILIITYEGDNEPTPFARVYDVNENILGAFDITTDMPTKESEVIAVRESEFGILTDDTRRKIVKWAQGQDGSNWGGLFFSWQGLNREDVICHTCKKKPGNWSICLKCKRQETCLVCEEDPSDITPCYTCNKYQYD